MTVHGTFKQLGMHSLDKHICNNPYATGVTGLKVILAVDAIKTPLTGVGRYALELANRLQYRTDIDEVRYFSQLAQRADIIHYYFPWPFMDVVHFATRVKKPTVVTYHSDVICQKPSFTAIVTRHIYRRKFFSRFFHLGIYVG